MTNLVYTLIYTLKMVIDYSYIILSFELYLVHSLSLLGLAWLGFKVNYNQHQICKIYYDWNARAIIIGILSSHLALEQCYS